jgi:hypothetical protein
MFPCIREIYIFQSLIGGIDLNILSEEARFMPGPGHLVHRHCP